ncbi:MAG: hypothetical protein WKF73_10675 [Nocardioidaceae bacterium]
MTSRTPLHVADEMVFAVPAMQTETADDDPAPSEATRLFLDRAAMATPGHDPSGSTTKTISDICQRLDGLAAGHRARRQLAAGTHRPRPARRDRPQYRLSVLLDPNRR